MSAATAEKPVVRRGPKRSSEFDSRSIKIQQRESIELPPLDEAYEREPDIVVVDEVKKHHADDLAFNEDPITIHIHRSGEKFSPMVTDLIAVNGVKATMLFKNGWVQMGYLPRGQKITTQRKFVEQLFNAKVTAVSTRVVENPGEDPKNLIDPSTTSVFAFTIVEDRSPRAAEWRERMIQQYG